MADGTADGLDVYARPFVPDRYRSVNTLPANVIPSEGTRWINFECYIGSFAGSNFLPRKHKDEFKETEQNVTLIQQEVSEVNYRHYFLNLLKHETSAREAECKESAIYNAALTPALTLPWPSMYWLEVPGLREGDLRIEVGDVVQLRQLHFGQDGLPKNATVPLFVTSYIYPGGTQIALQEQHDAIVWMINRRNEHLLLRADGLMQGSMRFNVCFTVQSGRMGSLRRAVVSAHQQLLENDDNWIRSMLFPYSGTMQTTLGTGKFDIKNTDPQLNYEQLKAIHAIVWEDYGQIPFLISGPPGTGKTKTLVELALQLLKHDSSAHLLVCAPSESASDTLVQRLSAHLKPADLLRLTAPSRSFNEVPASIKSYCCVDQDTFSLPSFAQLMALKIVVTTCQDADLLLRACVSNRDLAHLEQSLSAAIHPSSPPTSPRLHWKALLIDEAAQATEPETLIPLSVVCPTTTSSTSPAFIMAGDQHQLSPRVASRTPSLSTPLFARLFTRHLYRDHPLSRHANQHGRISRLTASMLPLTRPPFANLMRNYRSHPSILAVPSQLFYNDTLEPEAAAHTTSLLSWPGWRGVRWPVLFASNSSPDEIERDAGGWYNAAEAHQALAYARSFLQTDLISQSEICIMSPFAAQVKLLRHLARSLNLYDINIGPLEAFQGLESRLVILCTTRTRKRFVEQDVARGVGVVHEAQRFNVALTRAKEGLIVIGNPPVLGSDAEWRAFMGFCARNGLWDAGKGGAGKGKRMREGVKEGWLDEDCRVSRLERLLRADAEGKGKGKDGLEGGRRLGVDDGEESEMWRMGVEAERAVRDAEEAGGGNGDDEWW